MEDKNQSYQIEELLEILFDEDKLIRPERKLYRLTIGDDRIYYYFDENDEPVFKQSVTSAIRNNTPTSIGLLKWYAEQGWAEATAHRDERAAFGTFMHAEIESFLLNKLYDLDTLDDRLDEYCERERLPHSFAKKHSKEAKKALLAFVAFYQEYKVEPLAVEISLCSDKYGIAGMLDLPCTIEIPVEGDWGEKYKTGPKKDQVKLTKKLMRVPALIDFKSGKNFYDDHLHQLEIYRRIWNENFPDLKIDRIFNWSPKDFRGAPTFNFKEQKNERLLEKVDHILAMNEIDRKHKEYSAVVYSGVLRADSDLTKNVEEIDYSVLVKKQRGGKK